MPDWYYIGPDRTGYACPHCCDAFQDILGACIPALCSSGSFSRNYLCSPSEQPSPLQLYFWNRDPGTPVTVGMNPLTCGGNTGATPCYVLTNGPLNSAGRVGAGCSQVAPIYEYQCGDSVSSACSTTSCSCGCTFIQVPSITYNRCNSSCTSCESTGSTSAGYCECSCTGGCVCCSFCDPEDAGCLACCFTDCISEFLCDDGEIQYCNSCTGTCSPEECTPCPEDTSICDECGECADCECSGGAWACVSRTCDGDCGAGFTCSCGVCKCTAQSTCCTGFSAGWIWDPGASVCRPCDYPGYSRSNCCDLTWRRKGCASGSVCCNDGNCYDEFEVFCSLANGD